LKEAVVYTSERIVWFNMTLLPDDPLVVAAQTASGVMPPPRRTPPPDGDTMDVPSRIN